MYGDKEETKEHVNSSWLIINNKQQNQSWQAWLQYKNSTNHQLVFLKTSLYNWFLHHCWKFIPDKFTHESLTQDLQWKVIGIIWLFSHTKELSSYSAALETFKHLILKT